tara:strand:+ start:319 stop:753 length:435 start_codon:yes stop_codon:yes gene_type:complete
MANPFDFSSGAVLTAAQLNSIGAWETWTPTVNWSGTAANAKFCQVNGLVFCKLKFTLDATPSGDLTISQPVVEEAGESPTGLINGGYVYDTTDDESYAVAGFMSGANIKLATSDRDPQENVSATHPFTWASGDAFRFLIIYQAD